MLKNSRTPASAPTEEHALDVGVRVLEFLGGRPELLTRFLDLSGLGVEQLRREAARPAFFAGLLDFILDHEPTLETFVVHSGIGSEEVSAARAVLAKSFRSSPR